MRFSSQLEELPKMLAFVRKTLGHLNEKEMMQIEIAVEEALVNIISYAYPTNKGEIEIICHQHDDEVIEIYIQDWGIPFSTFEEKIKEEKMKIGCSVEEQPIGGLGIYLMSRLMDKVSYSREKECNIISLVKRTSSGKG